MKFTFSRSGGFAGPATAIQAEVNLEGKSARVTSAAGYTRDLPPVETEQLRALLSQLPQSSSQSDPPNPDQYQYDIELTRTGGTTQHVTLHDNSSHSMPELLNWVREECSRIWSYRISQPQSD